MNERGIGAIGGIGEVRSEDRGAVLAVPDVDDVGQGFLDPVGGTFLAEVVEHQQIGVQHRGEDTQLSLISALIVAVAHELQEVWHLVEVRAGGFSDDELLEDRHGQVSLPHPVRPMNISPLGAAGYSSMNALAIATALRSES